MLYSTASQYYYKFSFFITILYFLFAKKHIAMNLLESQWSAFIGYVHVAVQSPVAGDASSATYVRVPRYSLHVTVKFEKKSTNPYNFYNTFAGKFT